MEYAVIMAGGLGTRLWPLSRQGFPKQLLPVCKGKSLLQLSFERLLSVVPAERIYVCTAEAHRKVVGENLPQLPAANILGEPQGRDTANAVGFPAAILHKRDPDAVFAVVTADHVIEPIETFQACVRQAFNVTKEHPKCLVTFGIVPTFGHTGLGYIQRGEPMSDDHGAYQVLAFKEKPDKPTADRYVESGRFYWNSGMFVWRADTVLEQLAAYLPQSYQGLTKIAEAWDTPQQQEVVSEIYPHLPKISIDYAVMEPAAQQKSVVVVEMPIDWIDVGSYPALAETLSIDEHDNAVDCDRLIAMDADGNIIVSRDPNHLVSVVGVSEMIIIHTPDVTMICPKNDAQRVKELVAKVREKYGDQYL
ncbi:MAG: mannose-1-phosphate guanylyltransferase [Burkholderiales bacterium]|nr:mannose-1-phosphate guanylyltransferase [Phycisphaerae bacterium]